MNSRKDAVAPGLPDDSKGLERGLKDRHIQLIALGGAIGVPQAQQQVA